MYIISCFSVKMLKLLPTFQKAQNRNIQNNTFPDVLRNSFKFYVEYCLTFYWKEIFQENIRTPSG